MSSPPIYASFDELFGSLRQYAERNKLTPDQLTTYFNVGLCAVRLLRPDWIMDAMGVQPAPAEPTPEPVDA